MTAEMLALFAIGLVWPWLFQFFKERLGWSGVGVQWLAVITCFIIAFGATIATGGSTDPESIIKNGGAVTALAWLMYGQIIKPVRANYV